MATTPAQPITQAQASGIVVNPANLFPQQRGEVSGPTPTQGAATWFAVLAKTPLWTQIV